MEQADRHATRGRAPHDQRIPVGVRLDGISKRFRSVTALYPTTLAVTPGNMTALLGPSGCGKTTTLRIIAGLEAPDSGSVFLADREVTRVPPDRRGLGMVFQSYSLFPHMTVGENIAFGLKMARVSSAETAERMRAMLNLVRLPHIEDRYPRQLSGGQQQRVALARALVTNPSVLLLDEPLAALDRNLRENMQFELRQIQTSLDITTIIVTHDQEEALTMSDEVVVMDHGRVIQVGTPTEVYERPRTRFIAEFLGTANLFEGQVAGDRIVYHGSGSAAPQTIATAFNGTAGSRSSLVAVRPEKLWLEMNADRPADRDVAALDGTVIGHVFRGASHVYQVRLEGRDVPVLVYRQTRDIHGGGPDAGARVRLCWRPQNAVVLAPETADPSQMEDRNG
ncbi:MAG: ABC transporter ATP-binding protein [Alphaproteobacteria bacterium]|nr:ABC transporter ATP-binding protein [Alphaproteobacteria bacterium]